MPCTVSNRKEKYRRPSQTAVPPDAIVFLRDWLIFVSANASFSVVDEGFHFPHTGGRFAVLPRSSFS